MDFKNEVFAPCTSIFEAAVTISRRSSLNDALSSYLEALKLSPRLADATRGIAIVYERQASPLIDAGKYAEALRLLKQSLDIYPENYVFHFQLGRTYSLLKQEESALQAFNHALKLKPDFALAHYAKGLTLVGLDRFEAALDEASALKPLDEKLGNDLFDFVSKTVLNIKLAVLRQELEAQGTFSNPVQVSSGSMTEMIFFIPTSFASCDVSWRQSTATIAMNYSSAALAAHYTDFELNLKDIDGGRIRLERNNNGRYYIYLPTVNGRTAVKRTSFLSLPDSRGKQKESKSTDTTFLATISIKSREAADDVINAFRISATICSQMAKR